MTQVYQKKFRSSSWSFFYQRNVRECVGVGAVVIFILFLNSLTRSTQIEDGSPVNFFRPQVPVPALEDLSVAWKRNPNRKYVWIEIQVGEESVGKVVAELYTDVVPRTAENFRALVTGDNNPDHLSYTGNVCHRILENFVVQCGDITTGDGRGGQSIYGRHFDDEEAGLALKHDSRYVLQMANSGPDSNGSQFCFMLSPQPHLNGKHVVFGKVVDGFEAVDAMEKGGIQKQKVMLVRGGEYS